MLLKLYPHAVRVSCGQARVRAAYVRDVLAFPVAGETPMTGVDVGCTSEPLSCPEENSNSGKRLTVEKTEVVDPFITGSRQRTVGDSAAEPGRRADLRR